MPAALQHDCRPAGAYEVLGELRGANPGIAPPTISGALAALTEGGRVHRLRSLQNYSVCRCIRHPYASIPSIRGGWVAAGNFADPDLLQELSSIADKSGFAPMGHVDAVPGLGASCGGTQVQA